MLSLFFQYLIKRRTIFLRHPVMYQKSIRGNLLSNRDSCACIRTLLVFDSLNCMLNPKNIG